MMSAAITLVSHHLCPYVQRAAITLDEKQVPYERVYVDLSNKPDWFTAISPLGKVPLLRVGSEVLFESAVIVEYLEETHGPAMHPADPLERARHRAWIEFGSATLGAIGRFYSAPDDEALAAGMEDLKAKFDWLERHLGEGPYFAGERFQLVDAVFGPVFRYFEVFEQIADFGFFDRTPKVRAYRAALAARPSVRAAVAGDYPSRLWEFLQARRSALSRRMPRPAA
jgi:glutathione S-transferase